MVIVIKEAEKFQKSFSKLDISYKERVKKLIKKIIENPEIGKPMRHSRKGTMEVYVSPFRLSYSYSKDEDMLTFLEIYHKDEQ